MTKPHFLSLKRGDLIRQTAHPDHAYIVLHVNPEAGYVQCTMTGMALDYENWEQVDDEGKLITPEGVMVQGAVPPLMESVCRMCRGSSMIPEKGQAIPCPRCKGDGAEPTDVDFAVFEIRLFYATPDAKYPRMVMDGRLKGGLASRAQIAELLDAAVNTFKEGLPAEEKLLKMPTGAVN